MAKTSKKSRLTPISLSCDLAKLFDEQLRVEMSRSGMKASYLHFLQPLCAKDGITQNELMEIVNLKAPTVSVTLRNMESDGLVTRSPDKDDARAARVYITDKGRDAAKKTRAFAARLERTSLSGVTTEEKEQLVALLSKMKANITKTTETNINASHESEQNEYNEFVNVDE